MITTRIAKTLLAIVVPLAAAAGGTLNTTGVAEAAPAATPITASTTAIVDRPVDELVALGPGRMHIRCTGTGGTTVLLIAGWGQSSETWSAIEPTIAQQGRVCSYDRFGTGTSDPPATTQTFETQADDLHELLDEIGEPGPFVVVGHSFGGAQAVTFASMYPDEVDGLVIIEASPTTWPDTVCSVPAYAGGCAIMRDPTQDAERLDVFPAFERVATITTLGDLPMTVMTATHRSSDGLTPAELSRLDTLWAEGTARWAQLSTASSVVTVEDTGHDIQLEQPAVVIAEVMELLR